jgi:hypothetical protein
MVKLRRLCVLACAALLCVSTSGVFAASMGLGGRLRIETGSGSVWEADNSNFGSVVALPDGSLKVTGNVTEEENGGGWIGSWELMLGAGGVALSGNLNITSAVATTDTFEVTVSLPSDVALAAPTSMLGSVSINLSDNVAFGDGAELTTADPDPIYTAIIDGTEVQTLVDAPFSLVAGPFLTNSYGPENFSGAGPAVDIDDLIQIRHKFTLTAFDTAQVVSTFVITPEPGALMLLALGGTSAVFRLTRRRP